MLSGPEATGGLLSEAVSSGLASEDTTMTLGLSANATRRGLSSFLDVSLLLASLLWLWSSVSCLCIFI